MQVSFGSETSRYDIKLGTADSDALVPLSEECVGREEEGGPATVALPGGYREAWISHRDPHGIDGEIVYHIRSYLDSWRVYHFHDTSSTSPIKKTADVDDNRFLLHDGANLAAFL